MAKDTKESKSAKAEGGDNFVLVVTARAPRRRAGRAFGQQPVEITAADLSDDERAAIAGDPMLRVVVKPAAT